MPSPELIAKRKERAREKRQLHMELRMRGTGQSGDEEEPKSWMESSLLKPSPSFEYPMGRAVTRHSRKPALRPGARPGQLPKLIDVLSMHRQRSHRPARRHFNVFVPPASSPRLSHHRLEKLRGSPIEAHQREMRSSQSLPVMLKPIKPLGFKPMPTRPKGVRW